MAKSLNAAPLMQPKSEQAQPASSSENVFLPKDIGPNDFFRMRRKGNGWIVQMVRVAPEHERRDVWEWDLVTACERRLASLAAESEKKR
jgi:hypothetical protein